MPYPTQSPYDLLGVSPNANPRELMEAYARALAREPNRARELQAAYNDLKNPKSRLENDLLMYSAEGGEPETQKFVEAYGRQTLLLETVAPIDVGWALTDLCGDNFSADQTPIALSPVKITTTTRYDHATSDLLPPILDR